MLLKNLIVWLLLINKTINNSFWTKVSNILKNIQISKYKDQKLTRIKSNKKNPWTQTPSTSSKSLYKLSITKNKLQRKRWIPTNFFIEKLRKKNFTRKAFLKREDAKKRRKRMSRWLFESNNWYVNFKCKYKSWKAEIQQFFQFRCFQHHNEWISSGR